MVERHRKGVRDEGEEVKRGEDHRHFEGGRGGDSRSGAVPEVRDERRDVLQLEGEVRRADGERGEAAEVAGGGEPAPEAHRGGPDAR